MKKNISINISGILFHVEEDGYELLKNYLESISRYFAAYEDSKEITSDIEGRIAEIFLAKLTSYKQVITHEDVEGVMKTMGSVEDFAAAGVGLEEEDEPTTSYKASDKAYEKTYERQEETREETYADGNKKLYRDTQRKVLGGVAAGIAHYLKVDPLWIRLLLIALFFSDIFISMGGIIAIAYIVLWIVVPGSTTLYDDEKIKKFYRNPDDKVIAGVCGGIAAYFGADGTLVRLLFVLSVLFFGTGLVLYIVLWIITPQALTLTEKMRMKGEPVTLSNIESSIKKNFNVSESGEESTFLKVLLFPFRLIAVVLNTIGKALGPLMVFIGEAARVLFGLLLFVVGIAFVFLLLVTGGMLLGVYSADTANISTNLPLDVIRNSFPEWGLAFGYMALLIPSVALLLAGIAVVAKRNLMNPTLGWTALGIWFVCLAALSVTVVPYALDFQEDGRYNTTKKYDLGNTTAIITLDGYADNDYSRPELTLRGHDSAYFELREEFEAQGGNHSKAAENAQMISYDVLQKDSVLVFPAKFTFKEDAQFRAQRLHMVLYVPYQRAFMMDRNLTEILDNDILRRSGYDDSDLQDNIFMMTQNGLECVTCDKRKNMDEELDNGQAAQNPPAKKVDGKYSKDYVVSDFKAISVHGPFQVNVVRGEEYQVNVHGNEALASKVNVNVKDETLTLDYDENIFRDNNEQIGLSIVMPSLKAVEFGGTTQAEVADFSSPDFSIILNGSARATVSVNTDALRENLSGASRLTLNGQVKSADINMSGASRLDALNAPTENMIIKTGGASQAQVAASQTLTVEAQSAGKVRYQGNPTLEVNPESKRNVSKL